MYTEDDENVSVKKNNTTSANSDFYTSFNELDKKKFTSKNNKSKKASSSIDDVKDEQDYSDFYTVKEVEIEKNDSNDNKKKLIVIIASVVLFMILIILLIILLSNKNSGDIVISNSNISLNIGETEYISYQVINTESSVTSTFESSDTNVVVVSDTGQLTAIGTGKATVTIYYTIDGKTKNKECQVEVNNNGNVDQSIHLELKMDSGDSNTWTNKDVIINVNASSIFGITSIKYALNCDSNCNYSDLSNNQITISQEGTTNVKVIAHDKKNQEITKEVTVKIDKEAPYVTLNSEKNIVSNNDVEVCATCTDSLSGCKKDRVCKKYTSSSSNQVITVEDMAGNKKSTATFNVTINKIVDPCSLKVSSDGTVTATLREAATYYGFNSNYSGTNELSKKISINASKNGDSAAKVVYYYVKNKNGTGGKCFITVIKQCSCTDKNSNDANCPVTCTFTSQ